MRILIALLIFGTGCSVGRSSFSPGKKYSPAQLQKDYFIYQTMLEESHPGLYWYTSKDSMDRYFQEGAAQLKDSMTELQFRKILSYVTSRVNCGHTTVRASKYYSNYTDSVPNKVFPLSVKTWSNFIPINSGVPDQHRLSNTADTMVVTANLNRRDSILKRGVLIKKINSWPIARLVDTMFNYISTDGYNLTHKYQSLSNRGYFGSLHTSLFGLSEKYNIEYIDSIGQEGSVLIPVYDPAADTPRTGPRRPIVLPPPVPREELRQRRLNAARQLRIDTVNRTAFMDLNSFGRGYHLKSFFRRSFRALKKNDIGYLVVDVRSNGGGSVTNSTFLTRFVASQRFKVADSLYAIRKKTTYGRYIENDFFNRLFMTFLTRKKSDGYHHFGYFTRHLFKPKKKNHFDGNVYILTGGNSFSATTLFASSILKQENVFVVGEETGGAAYGNTAWLIPDATLPVTKVRFRLPLFRLVIDKNIPKDGRGVQPEISSYPTTDAIRRGIDFKMEKALELINKARKNP